MEDPSEAFEDLRDKTDLRMLFKHQEFLHEAYGTESGLKGKLGPPSDKSWVEAWRRKLKIATVRSKILQRHSELIPRIVQRQFERLIEMLILRKLDPTDPLALRAYRLQVRVKCA
jgi:histone acetyltransferase 1